MSVTAPVYDKSDPKTNAKLYPFSLPTGPGWEEKKGWYSQTAMMGAGAGMFIKNPLFAYGSLVLATIGLADHEPLRASKDEMNPLMSFGLALAGLVTVNMPRLMLAPEQKVEV